MMADAGPIRFEYRNSKKYPKDFHWVAMRVVHGDNGEEIVTPTRHMFMSLATMTKATLNLIHSDIYATIVDKNKTFVADVLGFNR